MLYILFIDLALSDIGQWYEIGFHIITFSCCKKFTIGNIIQGLLSLILSVIVKWYRSVDMFDVLVVVK